VDSLKKQEPQPGQDDLRGFEWRYFQQVCQGEQARVFSFTNKTHWVNFAISSDSTTLAVSEEGHELELWDIAAGRQRSAIPAQGIDAVSAFSGDGAMIAFSRQHVAVMKK
jgi:Tol biopolymer transport system component